MVYLSLSGVFFTPAAPRLSLVLRWGVFPVRFILRPGSLPHLSFFYELFPLRPRESLGLQSNRGDACSQFFLI